MAKERFDDGLKRRRAVLGADYVDRALARASGFSAPLQELVTEYAWGEVWGRSGLSPRERSMVTLGMLIALDREDEFKLHIRAAITNGCTPDDLREVLVHSVIYCGAPAAISATRLAEGVLTELGIDLGSGGLGASDAG